MSLRAVLSRIRLPLSLSQNGKASIVLVHSRGYMDGRSKRNSFQSRNNNYNRNSNNRYNGRVQRNDYEDDQSNLSKTIPAKLIHVPKKESNEEVTLEDLHKDGVIHEMLFKSISKMGFPSLTPVQQMTIKPIIESKDQDVIARAKTGTGKTFAFLLPIFQHLLNTKTDSPDMVRCVIVAPTRDLALQIESEIKKIYDNNHALQKFGSLSLIGGTNFGQYMKRMHTLRPNIVIATPGRLMATLERYSSKFFQHVDFLVLDEADRLLEIGFKEDLESISRTLNEQNSIGPDHVRTLLFSATLDSKVQSLAGNIMHKKECLFLDTVDKNEPEAHEKIDQSMVVSENFAHSIYGAIDHIHAKIETTPNYKAILFTPTVKFTQFLSHILRKKFRTQLPILEFHGKIDQKKRTNLVKQFKKEKSGILICTDVGARGMDFPNVQEVLQIGVPSELANYIHRIGRTARGGQEGASTIFLCKDELPFVEELSNRRNVTIANKKEYEPSRETIEQLSSEVDPQEFADVIISLISFFRTAIREYRFKENRLLPNVASTYGIMLADEESKIPIYDRDMLQRLGFRNSPLATKMFDLQGSAVQQPRKSNRDSYQSQNSYDGNRGNSRFSNNNRDRDSQFSSFNKNKRQSNFYGRKFYQNSQGENPRYED